jgi:hypothetical protein
LSPERLNTYVLSSLATISNDVEYMKPGSR